MELDKLIKVIKNIIGRKINVDSISQDDFVDISWDCIVDLLNKKEELDYDVTDLKIIEKIVNKNISKYINQIASPLGFGLNLPDESDLVNWDEAYGDTFYDIPEILQDSSLILLYDETEKISKNTILHSDLITVNNELIKFLKMNPKYLYRLDPRKFEELISAILSDMGYSVELTKQTRDGGVDIFATQKNIIGESLLIVDCKRYAPHKNIGVGVVRELYGITEQLKATMGIIATTSFFSKPAIDFQRTISHRISLKDYNDIISWLSNYGLSKI